MVALKSRQAKADRDQIKSQEQPSLSPAPLISLRLLNILMAIGDTGSLSGAAKRLGLTQSAISQAMQAFEDSLGQRLFDRSLRPPAFTMTGRLILKHAEEIIERAQQLENAIRFSSQAQLPLLRLGIIDTFATTVIPHLISDLADIASNWSVTSGGTETSVSAVLEHRVDMVITSDDPSRHGHLAKRRILTEPYCLVLPKGSSHLSTDIRELSAELDFINYTQSLHMKQQVESYLSSHQVSIRNRYQFNTVDAVMAMVEAGIGWSIATPLALLKSHHRAERLLCVPLPNGPLERSVHLVGHVGDCEKVMDKIYKSAVRVLRETTLPHARSLVPEAARTMRIG